MTAFALTPAEVSALFEQGSIFAICLSNRVPRAPRGRPPGKKITNYGATRDMARRIAAGEVTGDLDDLAQQHKLNPESLKITVWRIRNGRADNSIDTGYIAINIPDGSRRKSGKGRAA